MLHRLFLSPPENNIIDQMTFAPHQFG